MLKATRKADRKAMVDTLSEFAHAHGLAANLTAEGSSFYTKRGFYITLSREGLNASMNVDGDSRNQKDDCYVVAWHVDAKSDRRLSRAFEAALGQVNMYHRHKATTVVHGFEETILRIKTGFEMVANGTAWETTP